MSTEADPVMREEYDFSGGVRGRHAARFSAEGRQELLRRAAWQDVQVWTTHALVEVQQLEAALFACLHLVLGASPETALHEVATPGHRVDDILRATAAAGELGSDLRRVLSERHWLMHHSSDDLREALAAPEGATPLLQRLRTLTALAASARLRIERLTDGHLVQQGWSPQEIHSGSQRARAMWKAA